MIESIRCPNCGVIAERHHLSYLAQVKTQCEECDYLLITCTRSGHVIESYAPGLRSPIEPMPHFTHRPQNHSDRSRDVAISSYFRS